MPGYSSLVPPVIDLCMPRVRPLHSRPVIFSVSPLYVPVRHGGTSVKRHRRYGSRIFHRPRRAAPHRHLVTRLGVIKNARRSSEAYARTFIIARVVLRASNETSARSYFIAALYNSDNYYMTMSAFRWNREGWRILSLEKRESIAWKEKWGYIILGIFCIAALYMAVIFYCFRCSEIFWNSFAIVNKGKAETRRGYIIWITFVFIGLVFS